MLERTDSSYLESISDEEFFSRRFVMDEADQAELLGSSAEVDGARYYKAGARERSFTARLLDFTITAMVSCIRKFPLNNHYIRSTLARDFCLIIRKYAAETAA